MLEKKEKKMRKRVSTFCCLQSNMTVKAAGVLRHVSHHLGHGTHGATFSFIPPGQKVIKRKMRLGSSSSPRDSLWLFFSFLFCSCLLYSFNLFLQRWLDGWHSPIGDVGTVPVVIRTSTRFDISWRPSFLLIRPYWGYVQLSILVPL